MKILKKADVSDWKFVYQCGTCDSELEVYPSDLILNVYDGDYRESGYEIYGCKCAVCEAPYTVPTNSIPKLVKMQVKNK